MKCRYDFEFIYNYNEDNISIESKNEFESHSKNCDECRRTLYSDRALLNYVMAEVPVGSVPVDSILSRIDMQKYRGNTGKYRLKSLLHGMAPAVRIAVPAAAAVIALTVIFSNPAVFNLLFKGNAGIYDRDKAGAAQSSEPSKAESLEKNGTGAIESKMETDGTAPYEIFEKDKILEDWKETADEEQIKQIAADYINALYAGDTARLLELTDGQARSEVEKGDLENFKKQVLDKIVSLKVSTVSEDEVFVLATVSSDTNPHKDGTRFFSEYYEHIYFKKIDGKWLIIRVERDA